MPRVGSKVGATSSSSRFWNHEGFTKVLLFSFHASSPFLAASSESNLPTFLRSPWYDQQLVKVTSESPAGRQITALVVLSHPEMVPVNQQLVTVALPLANQPLNAPASLSPTILPVTPQFFITMVAVELMLQP